MTRELGTPHPFDDEPDPVKRRIYLEELAKEAGLDLTDSSNIAWIAQTVERGFSHTTRTIIKRVEQGKGKKGKKKK